MNLNDTVSVVLTEEGADILNQREEYFATKIPNYNKRKYKERDVFMCQLWMLFDEFGEHIRIELKTPFENNEIQFVKS